MRLLTASLAVAAAIAQVVSSIGNDEPLVKTPGDIAAIRGWYMQSTAKTSTDMINVSKPGFDVASWYRVGSYGTVMAGLIENKVFDDTSLFFSTNLKAVDLTQFQVPWLYREEITFNPESGQHYFLETNGISSKADLYLNGNQIASKDTLNGAYGGQKFDITQYLVKGKNAVLIRAYPTDFNKDFGVSFLDWNPKAPDRGMGVWREVTVAQTGPVSLLKPRVITDYTGVATSSVTATINVVVKNSGAVKVRGTLRGSIGQVDGALKIPVSTRYSLEANETKTITLTAKINDAQIWWPKLWGAQPLYTLDLAAHAGCNVSDRAVQRTFGIRHVTSHLNSNGARAFEVNGRPFLVSGGGYTPEIFLRFDAAKLEEQFAYVLDMGMNTVRLEGKMEHPAMYDIADRMGLMILAGWECCDKWEGWSFNSEGSGVTWVEADYATASKQMEHEAYMMQGHACMLGFLEGSDYWPDEQASPIYVNKLNELNWDVPIIASAAMRGFPENLGSSGMKMEGPYDWVPPNYWYTDKLGAAFGFGSELGSGVGTPELSSLKKFLTPAEIDQLWMPPNTTLYHQSTFFKRTAFDAALYARYGAPTSIEDYLIKAQAMDYEATRAEFEAYSAHMSAANPSTGLIYWMLNNAWPSLHWNQFDYYLKPGGSYFGTKVAMRPEHVAYGYGGDVWLINHTLDKSGARSIKIDLLSRNGTALVSRTVDAATSPNHSEKVATVSEATTLQDAAFLRLVLTDAAGNVLNRNVYWLSPTEDQLDWDKSTWYITPVAKYADFRSLKTIDPAQVQATAGQASVAGGYAKMEVTLENKATVAAYFVRLELKGAQGEDVVPIIWSDNYMTLWPGEKVVLSVSWPAGASGP